MKKKIAKSKFVCVFLTFVLGISLFSLVSVNSNAKQVSITVTAPSYTVNYSEDTANNKLTINNVTANQNSKYAVCLNYSDGKCSDEYGNRLTPDNLAYRIGSEMQGLSVPNYDNTKVNKVFQQVNTLKFNKATKSQVYAYRSVNILSGQNSASLPDTTLTVTYDDGTCDQGKTFYNNKCQTPAQITAYKKASDNNILKNIRVKKITNDGDLHIYSNIYFVPSDKLYFAPQITFLKKTAYKKRIKKKGKIKYKKAYKKTTYTKELSKNNFEYGGVVYGKLIPTGRISFSSNGLKKKLKLKYKKKYTLYYKFNSNSYYKIKVKL